MRQRNNRNTTERRDLIDFLTVADLLGITCHELAKLVATPQFPRPVDNERRGRWERAAIERYIRAARQFQAQPRTAGNDGPRAA